MHLVKRCQFVFFKKYKQTLQINLFVYMTDSKRYKYKRARYKKNTTLLIRFLVFYDSTAANI